VLGGTVTAAGWQVTLCDPISWYVISRRGSVITTDCYTPVFSLQYRDFLATVDI